MDLDDLDLDDTPPSRWARLRTVLLNIVLTVGLFFGASTAMSWLRAPDLPEQAPAFTLLDLDGTPVSLEAFAGQTVVLNFWATWCAPCRKEMPHLAELQAELGGDDFEVLTIATGRNSPEGIVKFFKDVGINNLPRHQDPKQALASQMGIFGLPITVLIDPQGREIARLRGDADWAGDSAKSIITALIEGRRDS